ncbi:MAG: hypothetical protein ACRDRJ_15385, partial [Streptosporangiaceae bacterium]
SIHRHGRTHLRRPMPGSARTVTRKHVHGNSRRAFVHWLNWDPHRPRKDRALVIYLYGKAGSENKVSNFGAAGDTGPQVKPVITPDDPDRVIAELAAHGVNVTSDQDD